MKLLFLILLALQVSASDKAPSQQAVAFVNVNVLPMNSPQPEILYDQTVTVDKSGSILEIGPSAQVKVPKNFLKIDGHGKYLLPGLSDMHIHLEFPEHLELMIAKGVTLSRVMWGKDEKDKDGINHFEFRRQIQQGKRIGPRLFIASTPLDGPNPIWPGAIVVETPEKASLAVKDMAAKGYDFIKVYNNLSADVYAVIMKEAKALGLPVLGHVPLAVDYFKAIDAGQVSFEHLEGSLVAMRNEIPYENRSRNWHEEIDSKKLAKYAERSQTSGVWNCPTLSYYKSYEVDEATLQSEESYRYVAKPLRDMWTAMLKKRNQNGPSIDPKGLEKRRVVVKALNDAKAALLVGTDSPNPYVVPGFSVHEELRRLVKSGIANYDAIRIGTYNAARFLKKLDQLGTIEKGKLGDMILIHGDPLQDVSNLENIKGVLTQGRWFSEEKLNYLLKKNGP